MSLAVVAVGVMQVFGVQVGYLCGCTGQTTTLAACEDGVCHFHVAHEDGDGNSVTRHEMEGAHEHDGSSENHHKHSEIRESLVVTTFRTVSLLPAVVFFDLPITFLVPEISFLPSEIVAGIDVSRPPEYGSPPMPVMVAQTIVMRI